MVRDKDLERTTDAQRNDSPEPQNQDTVWAPAEPLTVQEESKQRDGGSQQAAPDARDLVCRNGVLDQWNHDPAWKQMVVAGPHLNPWPTHLRPFTCEAQFHLVTHTYMQLQHSGYYWEAMVMEEAHSILTYTQPGTFLIRDSGQPDVFFTLSYRGDDAPTSVRVQLTNQYFSLAGSHKNFDSLFALLHSYIHSSHKLRLPYRKQRPESLQDMCRRAFIHAYGAQSIGTTSGLNTVVRDFLHLYPCCI